ncbi:hypothetical protein NicSoilB4_16530 [Arthrobacter sp. NicSoilB4]|uniref:DUF1801 domain-containing protein n=1 Tax=Arthrobacter sp. NicSoilB4 TaxID=2830997 RepID=UPI001CC748D5|nr:DUF1801 domain-containing protein [Arthrobacter sp. NicSoilB4]BCW66890.1 hypothetical protein NicSoilB4_16530 [Arthrobacter sp. NicSoilB4]
MGGTSNRNPDVDAWLEGYENPQRELVGRIREFILAVDPAVTEAIKWQAPTFMYLGNIASFFPKAKKNVTLMFHQGASLADRGGLLEGEGGVSRVARFSDAADFEAKKPALQAVIEDWIRARS